MGEIDSYTNGSEARQPAAGYSGGWARAEYGRVLFQIWVGLEEFL